MKKLSLILCILMLLNLLGCGTKEVSPETDPRLEPVCGDGPVDPTDTEETPAPTEIECSGIPPEPPTELEVPDVPIETSFEAVSDIPIETVIETKYYTITIPDSWATSCFYSVIDETNIIIREAGSYESFGGGKLCSLIMIPTDDESYKDFPNFELLCVLNTPEGNYYVIALFPTNVQFNEDTMDGYNAMNDELMDVLYTIRPVGRIEMAMP